MCPSESEARNDYSLTQAWETGTICLRQPIQEKEMHWEQTALPPLTRARTYTESHLMQDFTPEPYLGRV